ncbi:MAG: hypothetical protein Q8O46_02840, partial [bacterium]|nr:hypothetical protein [bacterium]
VCRKHIEKEMLQRASKLTVKDAYDINRLYLKTGDMTTRMISAIKRLYPSKAFNTTHQQVKIQYEVIEMLE